MKVTPFLLLIFLMLTGCAMHKPNANLIDEGTLSFRLKKLESKTGELSQRMDNLEKTKPSEKASDKPQVNLFLWIMAALAGALASIVVTKAAGSIGNKKSDKTY